MQKRATPHFDIYYAKGSTAERDIDQIAERRESGYGQIRDFLGCKDEPRVRLVFFEDQLTKFKQTGHRGAGMASGTTVVEVYNDTEKLDPFHETTHILSASLGNPPAIFSEGLATYMSERLGAPPLKIFGGGESSLYERVRQLKKDGQWIPLPELLTYTDIGSEESQPVIAYPEAGAFVRFLIDTYGRDKFLEAYSSLHNTADEDARRQNHDDLRRIYGKSVPDLDIEWHSVLGLPCEETGTVP
jgi:hypothetical protein